METIIAFVYSVSGFIFGILVGYSVCAILDCLQKFIRKFVKKVKK